jgi:hypothetical protein
VRLTGKGVSQTNDEKNHPDWHINFDGLFDCLGFKEFRIPFQ